MELHPFNLVAAVTEPHDDAVIGFRGDGEFPWQGSSLHDEGVVARGGEGVRQLAEQIFAVVMDLAGFAMKQFRRANDLSPKRCANGLVS